MAVLDVDVRHGGDRTRADLLARHGPLLTTPREITGARQPGQHIYFKLPAAGLLPEPANKIVLGPGLELFGGRNMVVISPSVHRDGRSYHWELPPTAADLTPLPTWIIDMAHEEHEREHTAGFVDAPDTPSGGSTYSFCHRYPAVYVGPLFPGQRDNGLFQLLCSHRAHGASDQEIYELAAQFNRELCRPPLPDNQVEAKARQVCCYPIGGVTADMQPPGQELRHQAAKPPATPTTPAKPSTCRIWVVRLCPQSRSPTVPPRRRRSVVSLMPSATFPPIRNSSSTGTDGDRGWRHQDACHAQGWGQIGSGSEAVDLEVEAPKLIRLLLKWTKLGYRPADREAFLAGPPRFEGRCGGRSQTAGENPSAENKDKGFSPWAPDEFPDAHETPFG